MLFNNGDYIIHFNKKGVIISSSVIFNSATDNKYQEHQIKLDSGEIRITYSFFLSPDLKRMRKQKIIFLSELIS
jgi:hypothetical protein